LVALEKYRQAIINADLRILLCKKELLDIKARLFVNPYDEHLIAVHDATQHRLEDHLRDCYFMQKLFAEVELDIDARVQLFGHEFLEVYASLKISLGLMERGIFKTCLDLNLHIDLNLHSFLHRLSCVLTGSRHSILNIDIRLVENVHGLLGFLFRFDDRCHEGESYDDLKHLHHRIIRSAVASCAQNPYVIVEEPPHTTKRSIESESTITCEYKVTITDPPAAASTNTKTVAMATEETGMSATTTTSSSSSLVVSFFVLFVSILCFF